MTDVLDDVTPEEIESEIARTRASLNRKIDALHHRLSPSARLQEVRARLHPPSYDAVAGWAAVGAVATGAYLAVRGLSRAQHHNGRAGDLEHLQEDADLELDGEDGVMLAIEQCVVDDPSSM